MRVRAPFFVVMIGVAACAAMACGSSTSNVDTPSDPDGATLGDGASADGGASRDDGAPDASLGGDEPSACEVSFSGALAGTFPCTIMGVESSVTGQLQTVYSVHGELQLDGGQALAIDAQVTLDGEPQAKVYTAPPDLSSTQSSVYAELSSENWVSDYTQGALSFAISTVGTPEDASADGAPPQGHFLNTHGALDATCPPQGDPSGAPVVVHMTF